MISIDTKPHLVACGALLSFLVGLPALADDTEIYATQAGSVGARPNVLFIIDTSGSMDTEVETRAVYDPDKTYSGSCSASNTYFSNSNDVPGCNNDSYIPATANVCNASKQALATAGGGVWPVGSRAKAGQYRRGGDDDTLRWRRIRSGNSSFVECEADDGVHGATDTSADKYIANSGNGFDDDDRNIWDGSGVTDETYRFYSGNYLNYYNNTTVTTQTRLQIVRDVAITLAGGLQNVNLGLMRYDSDAQGGMVIQAVDNIATNSADIIDTLDDFNPRSGDGYTPLSETLYEAALYYRGDKVDYGDESSPSKSVTASRVSGDTTRYKSPISYQCQKNYIVYLTDGLPTRDHDANTKAGTLVGKTCDDPDAPSSSGWQETDGRCTDDLAEYLYNNDQSSTQTGKQTVSTYMIGFGADVQESISFLSDVAKAGGTEKAYTAADTDTLTQTLQQIFTDISKRSASFVTPSIPVNAFNRAQTSDELYFTLFQADQGLHWPGNLKKYRRLNGKIAGQGESSVVDANGFFSASAKSIWSTEVDGAIVAKGGAASLLKAPDSRLIYTYLGSNPIKSDANALKTSNTAITDLLVGAGVSNSSCGTACQATINWARGKDVTDLDKDNDKEEQVRFMGDPLHASLGIVTYGGTKTTPDEKDTVVYVPTNDGFLHAISGKTGEELWAFIPPELLARLSLLKENGPYTTRSYGLDGDVRVLKYDKNRDNVIVKSDGDFVWIFFGMRSGGSNYYALDVTDAQNPALKWNIGPSQLPGVGQTWSTPAITRVKVTGSYGNDNKMQLVLIFGGGYDSTQENQPYNTDTVGNRLFMVDAETGKLLWYGAGKSQAGSSGNRKEFDEMNNSIPAPVTTIDINGDGFADRMYVGDMGGRVWRFDIFNNKGASELVTGGVLAKLGAGGSGANPAASTARRFYNAADVALIQQTGQNPYYNIAIGSGYRGHPLNTVTEEHFYSLRDKRPFGLMAQSAYNSLQPILASDANLVDITANPAGTPVGPEKLGWKLRVSAQSGRSGEKVLSKATTFANVILFTTFQPGATAQDSCLPAYVNRVYALYASSGKPALNLNNTGNIDNSDVSKTLDNTSGIAGGVQIGIDYPLPSGDGTGGGGGTGGGTGNGGGSSTSSGGPQCLVNLQVVPCPPGGGTARTFWKRKDAK